MTINSHGALELEAAYKLLNVDAQKSYEMYDGYSSLHPDDTAPILGKIFALNRMQKWEAARNAANDYIALAPDKDSGYLERAEAHYRMGLYLEAISDSHKVIALDPNEIFGSLPYRLIAMSHAQLGNLNDALSYANHADKLSDQEWYPPIGPVPSGTMTEFKTYLENITKQALY